MGLKMKKITEMALEWNADGMSDRRIIDNVVDDVMGEILDRYDLDLNEPQQAKLEMLLNEIIVDNIEWDALEDANREAADYAEAKRSAIYK